MRKEATGVIMSSDTETQRATNPNDDKGWFPINRYDIGKIERAHPVPHLRKLIHLWLTLVGLGNRWQKVEISIDQNRLASMVGVSNRKTVRDWLSDLERLKLIKLGPVKQGKGGRYETSTIKLKPSSPYMFTGNSEDGDHVQNQDSANRTVSNNTPLKAGVIVAKKPASSVNAAGADSPPLTGGMQGGVGVSRTAPRRF